eukprot:357985-Chlamydomonas_euryale.AAC.2
MTPSRATPRRDQTARPLPRAARTAAAAGMRGGRTRRGARRRHRPRWCESASSSQAPPSSRRATPPRATPHPAQTRQMARGRAVGSTASQT